MSLDNKHIAALGRMAKTDAAELAAVENNYRPVNGRTGGKAGAVIYPENTEQVSAILKYCNENGLKIFTQGGNTGLVGGSTPDDSGSGIVLKLTRMNKILSEVNENSSSVRLQAGVIVDVLNDKLAAHDLLCSIKHGGTGSATVGGSVATNAGGANAIKYGVTRDQVVGMTVVLPNGEIMKLGGNLKDTANNLMHTFIGNEGMFGVITEVEMKIHQKPKHLETVLVTFDEIKNITPFLMRLKKEFGKDGVEAFEYMNGFIFNRSKAITPDANGLNISADKQHYVLFEVSSAVEGLQERLINFLNNNSALIDINNSLPAFDGTARALLWSVREHCTDASRRLAGANAVRFDNCVPLERLPEMVDDTWDVVKKKFANDKLFYAAFGHWGDGNIHQHVIAEQKFDIIAVEKLVLDHNVKELGGSPSAEHGYGRIYDKLEYMHPTQLRKLKEMKKLFDPKGILNPGIMLK